MRCASSSEVAKLPRLVPLSLASIRRGTRTRSAPAATNQAPSTAHSRMNRESHSPSRSRWSSWKILRTVNGKVLPECLPSSSSRRTAMAGRDGGFLLPPLRSRTSAAVTAAVTVTGSHGPNHSAFSAGVARRRERGGRMRRGPSQKLQPQQQRQRGGRITERHSRPTTTGIDGGTRRRLPGSCARCGRWNGCGWSSARHRFDVS